MTAEKDRATGFEEIQKSVAAGRISLETRRPGGQPGGACLVVKMRWLWNVSMGSGVLASL